MTERPHRHLCPEADLRDGMSDDEFWAHVSMNLAFPPYQDFDPDGDYYDPVSFEGLPCGECGEVGACAYDSEGRPMIHAETVDD